MENNSSISSFSRFPAAALSVFMLSALTTWLLIVIPPKSGSLLSSFIDKVALAKQTAPPRIIFTGGSNLPFGINSDEISHSLGIPVIDIGLHAGFGLKFIINQSKASMKSGDVVVFIPEYELFSPGHIDGSAELATLAVFWPRSLQFINSPGQYLSLFRYFPEALKNRMREIYKIYVEHRKDKDLFGVYRRSAFNAQGDIKSDLTPLFERVDYDAYPPFTLHDRSFSLIHHFIRDAERRHVKIILMFPAVAKPYYDQHRKTIERIYEKLRTDPKIALAGNPADFVFPENYFYDTVYHLNAAGRKARTEKIVEMLFQTGLFQNDLEKEELSERLSVTGIR